MPAEFIYTAYKLARHYPPVDRARGHLAVLLSRCEDRGHRAQRRRQVEPSQDHGRARRRLQRRGSADPGFTVGYLDQEPQLDPAKDVKGNVLDGVHEVQSLIDQYDAVMARWGGFRCRLRRHRCRAGGPGGPHRRRGRVEPGAQRRYRDGRAACPPDDADVRTHLRRREAPRGARTTAHAPPRTCCCSTNRRTTSMPSRSNGSSASCRSTPVPSSPSPMIDTSSTTSPSGP